jgi:hypothetical protein
MSSEVKICISCEETLPISSFYTYTKPRCRTCESVRTKVVREEKNRQIEEENKKRQMEAKQTAIRVKPKKIVSSDSSSDSSSEDGISDRNKKVTPDSDPKHDERTYALEKIVKMQWDFIKDLQRRVEILEDKLLEKSVEKLAIK